MKSKFLTLDWKDFYKGSADCLSYCCANGGNQYAWCRGCFYLGNTKTGTYRGYLSRAVLSPQVSCYKFDRISCL